MLPVSSSQRSTLSQSPEIAQKKKNHIHITTEGYKYIRGGNGVFVNTFCKAFHQRSCRNVMILPLLEFRHETEKKRSITDGYMFSCGQGILVERCSKMTECDVYRIQPTGEQKKYFEKHSNPYDIEPDHKALLTKDLVFPEVHENNTESLKSTAGASLKFCIFNKIAAMFVNEILLPTLTNEEVYVHDHYFGGSLQYIDNRDNVRKINWIHCLSPHTGFSDIMIDKQSAYTTTNYLSMDVDQLTSLPDTAKPVRERAIKHADVVLTVSRYAQLFLTHQHPLIAKFLSIHNKEIVAIKSCSDLSQFDLCTIAKQYGLEGTSKKSIKQEFKSLFFAEKLPVLPPGTEEITQFKESPIVFFMGRPHHEKGVSHVVNMIKRLDCLFFIVSNGIDSNPFIQEVCKVREKRKNLILLTQDQQHKKLLMAIADYAVIPSLAESSGLIAGECNAMGLHTIISNVGGLPESSPDCNKCRTVVRSDAQYGFYSEETDKRFLTTIKKKLTSKEILNPSHIIRHARNFHSIDQFISSIENLLYDQ